MSLPSSIGVSWEWVIVTIYAGMVKMDAPSSTPLGWSGLSFWSVPLGILKKHKSMSRRFLQALAAVLTGAAIYLLLQPHLPRVAQHHLFQQDLGLLIYALISAMVYGLLLWLDRK